MSGKAAGSPRTGGTRATENAASVSLRGPRGNVEQRGAFPWGANQWDQATAKRLWTRETLGLLGEHREVGQPGSMAAGMPEDNRSRQLRIR